MNYVSVLVQAPGSNANREIKFDKENLLRGLGRCSVASLDELYLQRQIITAALCTCRFGSRTVVRN